MQDAALLMAELSSELRLMDTSSNSTNNNVKNGSNVRNIVAKTPEEKEKETKRQKLCDVSGSPLVLGEDARAMAVASALQARGFDIRGIRPPTVPEGTARLRIVVTGHVGAAEIAALADALRAVL